MGEGVGCLVSLILTASSVSSGQNSAPAGRGAVGVSDDLRITGLPCPLLSSACVKIGAEGRRAGLCA